MNKPPIRLLESADLSSAERTLLDAARAVPPAHYDAVAGAAKFQATLSSLPASGVATVTGAKSLTVLKLAAVVIPVLGAASYYATRPNAEVAVAPAQPRVTQVAPTAEVPTAVAAEPVTDVSVEAPEREQTPRADFLERPRARPSARTEISMPTDKARSQTSVATAAPEHEPALPVQAHVQDQPQPQAQEPAEEPTVPEVPAESAPPAPSESINELRAIAQARTLLERDPATALTLLQRIERAHPKGYFVEERLALTVIALARTGDEASARSQAIRFLRSYPKSPFADRVRAAVQ